MQSRKSERGRLGTDSLRLQAVTIEATLTSRTYDVLREAIAEMPIYDGTDDDCRLDERALAERLGISRTPVREALLRLENEGVVQAVPRKGIYVVRKTKAEIIEVILASAALEAMAGRLAAERATDEEIADLLVRFPQFHDGGQAPAGLPGQAQPPGQVQPAEQAMLTPISDYSALNLNFHQRIVDLAHSELFSQHISRLKIHMRAIRQRTIGEHDRRAHSVVEHAGIIAALRARDADLVEARVRQHAVGLAEHVKVNVSYLK